MFIKKKNFQITLDWWLIVLFTVMVLSSVVFANMKRLALAYDAIDYPLYAQFAARFFDSNLLNNYSAQSEGFNFLGYVGTEGQYSFNQSLHIEPLKYIYAIIFALFETPIGLYLFISTIYFSPLLYLAFLEYGKSVQSNKFIALFALLYALYPSTLASVTYDLRPRIFWIPFFTLSIIAVLYKRPFLEKMVLVCTLFLAREEALLFSGILIAVNFFTVEDWHKSIKETGALVVVWLAYLLGALLYFNWTGYVLDGMLKLSNKALSGAALTYTIVSFVLVLLVGFWVILKGKVRFGWAMRIASYAAIFLPLGIQLQDEVTRWHLADGYFPIIVLQRLFFSSKMLIYFIAVLLFLLLIWKTFKNVSIKKTLTKTLLVALIIITFASVYRVGTLTSDYLVRMNSAIIVFDLVKTTDSYSTHVLTDEYTYQAFYNYENVVLYNRLPWSVAQEQRYYPDNLPFLEAQIGQIEYVVISHDSTSHIFKLLENQGVTYKILSENTEYIVIKLHQDNERIMQ